MNIGKKYATIILLFFNVIVFAQQSTLDLSQPEQQKDFLKYLRMTTSLLDDKSTKDKMKGYDLKNISDSNKREIASKMMKDTGYFKRVMDYFIFLKAFENKYHISNFTHEEWKEVTEFGAKHGIYYISAMKKLNQRRDTLPVIPYNFPIIPFIKDTSKTNSSNFRQDN